MFKVLAAALTNLDVAVVGEAALLLAEGRFRLSSDEAVAMPASFGSMAEWAAAEGAFDLSHRPAAAFFVRRSLGGAERTHDVALRASSCRQSCGLKPMRRSAGSGSCKFAPELGVTASLPGLMGAGFSTILDFTTPRLCSARSAGRRAARIEVDVLLA